MRRQPPKGGWRNFGGGKLWLSNSSGTVKRNFSEWSRKYISQDILAFSTRHSSDSAPSQECYIFEKSAETHSVSTVDVYIYRYTGNSSYLVSTVGGMRGWSAMSSFRAGMEMKLTLCHTFSCRFLKVLWKRGCFCLTIRMTWNSFLLYIWAPYNTIRWLRVLPLLLLFVTDVIITVASQLFTLPDLKRFWGKT